MTRQISLDDGECRNIQTALAIAVQDTKTALELIDSTRCDNVAVRARDLMFSREESFKILGEKFLAFYVKTLEFDAVECGQNSEAPKSLQVHKSIVDIPKEFWEGT